MFTIAETIRNFPPVFCYFFLPSILSSGNTVAHQLVAPFSKHGRVQFLRQGLSTQLGEEDANSEDSSQKKRHRRTHSELSRDIVCPFPDCGRCYASKHALHLHLKNKHGWVGAKKAVGAAVAGSSDELNGIRSLFKGEGGQPPPGPTVVL